MRFEKIISTFIVLSMVLQMFYIFPASAEVGNNLYKYEDYSVEYTVTNEWDGGQTVEIKIINTGTESILNWAVKYDIDGEISNLWNAQVYDSKDNTYIFKNCGWNYEIRPKEYVTFGYTIKNHTFSMPEKFISCSERETLTLGYSVDLNIISEWDTGAQGEIVVTNTSTEPLEAWVLSFDSTFSIDNLWDARVLLNVNNHYSIASESWTNPIAVGESKVIGFVASKTTETQLEIANYSLSVIKINNNLNESDSSEDDKILDKLIISAYGGYVAETDSIDIFWMSTISDGTFEVLVSEDNIEYTVIKTVTDTDGCSIKADLIQKYIKVKQTANDQTVESQTLVVTKTGNGYIIDYTDTDNDGLYDYIEETVGSDKLLSDTDNDGLSDYEEVYLTNTDPAVYNSVESDLSDAEADSDNDGLSNYDEIVLGTMPLNDDSDEDGLIDGDEINQHDTDPLKYDTDNDGICDGDEIILGLDPNNVKTKGVLDCEYTTIQVLDSNNDIFLDINTEENSYSISLELCISGLADTNLKVRESGYSEIVQNDAILGSVLELDYPDNLLVEDVKINFEIKDEYIKNSKSISYDEFKGIKRLNVFRYFEEMNMLLPIESFHDTKTNTVYAETDMLGTYCLIDMETWLDNIGITSGYSSNITTATLSENIVDENSEYTATEHQANSENITNYENTDSTNVQETTFVIVLEPIVEFNDEIRDEYFYNAVYKYASDIDKEYEKYKIYFLDSKGNILTSPYGLNYATSLYDVHCICTNYSYSDIYNDYDHSVYNFYVYIQTGGRVDKTDFAKLLSGMYLQDRNLAEFLLLPSTQLKEYMTFSNESLHFQIKFAFGLQYKTGYVVKIPQILTATGLTPLPKSFGEITPLNDLDYDNDGLANNVEIDWNNPLISNGKLPTLETCIYTANSSGKLTYVENGLERLRRLPCNAYYELLKAEILPLSSNPLSKDSDGDGANDDVDPDKLILPYFGTTYYYNDLAFRLKNHDSIKKHDFDITCYEDLINLKNNRLYALLIEIVIDDLNLYKSYQWVSDSNWDNFCEFFNFCIINGTNITAEKHYIRNKLNRAPLSLEDMICEYDGWILCEVSASAYHMAGEDGEYNLKFVSKCGKYEAVYNKDGVLLTEHNDPANMGTYNYAGYKMSLALHSIFDVNPYNSFGNVPNVPPNRIDILSYYLNDYAQKYYHSMKDLLESDMDINTKIENYREIVDDYVK